MKDKIADRLNEVSPSAMRRLFEIAGKLRNEGKKVIDFGLGDIDIGMPDVIKSEVIKAMENGKTRYSANAGEPKLREKISENYNNHYNLDTNLEHVLITCGAVESLLDIAFAYVNPGDEVIVQEPMFAYFGFQVLLAGGKIIPASSDSEKDFILTPETIQNAITPRTKLVAVNYPTNPTAGVLDKSTMKSIVEVCEDAKLLLISDEVYEKITYDNYQSPSAIDYGYENTMVVNSASKAFCMTGMRVGYTICSSKDILAPVIQMHQYNTAHATVPAQFGALAGLKHEKEIIKNNMQILNTRRKALMNSWNKIPGIEFSKPKATFYLYPDISETGMNATQFSEFALNQGVVVVPGKTFCFSSNKTNDNFVRLSYGVNGPEAIKEAAEMIIEGFS